MLVKSATVSIGNFESAQYMWHKGLQRVYLLSSYKFLLISNDDTNYTFRIYELPTPSKPDAEKINIAKSDAINSGTQGNVTAEILTNKNDQENIVITPKLLQEFSIEYTLGQLTNVLVATEETIWLEFEEMQAAYEESYNIIMVKDSMVKTVKNFPREFYNHDLSYHHLFIINDALHLFLLKHNRIHLYLVTEDAVTELDVIEGGQWYLCGNNPICKLGQTIEIYSNELAHFGTIEYENDIDEVRYANSNDMLAFSLSDHYEEHTSIIVLDLKNEHINLTASQYKIADIGISAGKVWLNPYEYTQEMDLGGCMILDKEAMTLYTHLRARNITSGHSIGAYPPVFHRTDGIFALSSHATMVYDTQYIKIIDNNARPIQEISVVNNECFTIPSGERVAILNLKKKLYVKDEHVTSEDVTLHIYEWVENKDKKVFELLNFNK